MNKTLKLLFKNKIGLVLAGGGAKGAYQVGVFQAMQELGIDYLVKVVSGTSIGALNGALFVLNNPERWMQTWKDANFENFLSLGEGDLSPKRTLKHLQKVVKRSLQNLEKDWKSSADIEEFLLKQNLSLFSQKGLAHVMRDHIDFAAIEKSKVKLYACAYNIDLLTPEYISLNKLGKTNIFKSLLASACIPFLFPPVNLGTYNYMDGGIHIPLYKQDNTDNVPIRPVLENNCDIIIVVYLNHEQSIDHERYKEQLADKILLEIYPSQPLEIIKGTGSFDFSRGNLDERIELGYHDGMFIIAPMLVKLLQGKRVEELIEHLNKYNRHTRRKFTK